MFKKLRVTLVAAMVCACSLAIGVGAASASGSAPTTTTITAASVTAVSANIEGTITPNGSAITAASFCYGTSSTLAGCTSVSLSSSMYSRLSSSSVGDPVYATISGLSPGTAYSYYSLSATNTNGSASLSAPNGSFTTLRRCTLVRDHNTPMASSEHALTKTPATPRSQAALGLGTGR